MKPAKMMKRVLMVSPEHFRVEYAINPFMKDAAGELNKVDPERARAQWEKLRNAYEKLGFTVVVLPGVRELPDMVFAANQSFPFWDEAANMPAVVMAKMRSEFRRGEVSYFRRWYEKEGYRVIELEASGLSFEGNGDAILSPGQNVVWGASGPRTSPQIYDELSARTGLHVQRLTLVNPLYYHLDTCFSILSPSTVAITPSAFGAEDLKKIRAGFETVIEIDEKESKESFAGNCHCPDGKHVLVNEGAKKFSRELTERGFTPIEIDTSEFLKSGGSVFCLKMMVY